VDYATLIGLIAGALTTFAYVPQIVKTWRTRSAKDLSVGWIIILLAGTFLWTVYGVIVYSIPVIAANVVSFILGAVLLILKMRYG
jgi:MtN3 and saliva related transmembrane protein